MLAVILSGLTKLLFFFVPLVSLACFTSMSYQPLWSVVKLLGPWFHHHLAKLVAEQRVTIAAGVPTIWMGLYKQGDDWLWSNGHKLAPATAFWAPGHPLTGKQVT